MIVRRAVSVPVGHGRHHCLRVLPNQRVLKLFALDFGSGDVRDVGLRGTPESDLPTPSPSSLPVRRSSIL